MKTFLEAVSFVAKSSEMVISQDCFIRETTTIEPIYVKMMLCCFIPLMGILIFAIFWLAAKAVKRSINFVNNFIVSVIVLIFVLMPAVTTVAFSIFNC